MDSINASKVAQYLIQAEAHARHTQPFSWLLIRPPLASSMVCCKAVVCHRIQQHCQLAQDKVSSVLHMTPHSHLQVHLFL